MQIPECAPAILYNKIRCTTRHSAETGDQKMTVSQFKLAQEQKKTQKTELNIIQKLAYKTIKNYLKSVRQKVSQ